MSDPYIYPGTNVLRNRLGIQDPDELELLETRMVDVGVYGLKLTPLRLPIGVARLKATHKAIFGEVYEWAGEFRQNTGSMQKWRAAGYPVVYGPSQFIPQEMDRIFAELKTEKDLRGISREQFAGRAAFYYGEMDGTHPFREGNSRTLRQFFADVARGAGFDLDWSPSGVTAESRAELYRARDAAAMQRQPAALAAILLAGLKKL